MQEEILKFFNFRVKRGIYRGKKSNLQALENGYN